MKVKGNQSRFKTEYRKSLKTKYIFVIFVAIVLLGFISSSNLTKKITQKLFQLNYSDIGYGRFGSDNSFKSIFGSFLDGNPDNHSKLEVIKIDVKYENWSKITKKRSESISAGYIVQNEDDYVPAKITFRGEAFKADIRLKGDMVDHLKDDKWSFRVKTKGNSNLLGLKKFNLQHPMTRGYHTQFVINKVFKDYNLIVQKHDLVKVIINGDDIGIMLIEEHFSKELLERNKRKDGVIIKFDETNLWKSLLLNNGNQTLYKVDVNPFHSPFTSGLDVYSKNKVIKDDYLFSQYEIAISLLDGFRRGELKASEAFDSDLMGRYLGILTYFKAGHDSIWSNLRLYLNPYTLKLEPIPSEAGVGYEIPPIRDLFTQLILKDTEIKKVYYETVRELNLKYLKKEDITLLKNSQEPYLSILKKEFFFLEGIDNKLLGNCLPMSPLKHPNLLDSKIIKKDQIYLLEVSNISCKNISIKSITEIDRSEKIVLSSPIFLEPFVGGEVLKSKIINLKDLGLTADDASKFSIEVHDIDAGLMVDHLSTKYPEHFSSSPFIKPDISELQMSHSFISIDGKNINFAKGEYDVDGHIAIPCGYTVIINNGTILNFDTDGFIYSCSPILINGSSTSKVVFRPKKNVNSWKGMAIYNANKKSLINHLLVEKTSEFKIPFINLTGGVTFYKSNVEIRDSMFVDSFGEDALNIIHSDMYLENISIVNTFSDAFDGDFVTGSVVNSNFYNIGYGGGGDAIDVSGSKISINGGEFLKIDDKAISIGEASNALIKNILIKNSGIAIASKDASIVNATNLDLDSSNKFLFMSYMKKPVYGGAKIIIENFKFDKSKNNFAAQTGSSLIINNIRIKEIDIDVDSLYGK